MERPFRVPVAHYTNKARVPVARRRLHRGVLAAVFVLGSRYDRGQVARIDRLTPLEGCLALAR